ncbi:MAG: glycosyltransferase family 2 protein [Gemmatimonadota bacterium]|nr:glycosyltransferase family 2 protein [Gemmatimonadota bacterium]
MDRCITALLPVKHHHPQHLRESIESLFAQTSGDWRLLVIVEPEDMDTFRSLLCEALRDPRTRLIPNEGYRHAGAFNTGMRAAESEFVAILLSDDMWEPHAVATLQANILAHPEADLFHSGRRIVDGERRPISEVFHPPNAVSLDEFVWKSPVKHLICWRVRTGLSCGGMDETLTTAGPDDYDFPWTMLEHGAVMRAIQDCLYVYRDHRDAFRNTTHIPRSVHLRDLRHILTKHGVAPSLIREKLRHAKRQYLRQCLYRNALDRRIKLWLRFDPRSGWRQTYI